MQLFLSTAGATFRQAVALIFDHVVLAESLPSGKFCFGGQLSRTSSVTGDVNRSINLSEYVFSPREYNSRSLFFYSFSLIKVGVQLNFYLLIEGLLMEFNGVVSS